MVFCFISTDLACFLQNLVDWALGIILCIVQNIVGIAELSGCQKFDGNCIQQHLKLSNRDGFVSIGEAAQSLGGSIITLRRWEREGKLVPEHTSGGHRRYDLAKR